MSRIPTSHEELSVKAGFDSFFIWKCELTLVPTSLSPRKIKDMDLLVNVRVLGLYDFKASDSNLVRLVGKPKCFLCPLPYLKPRAEVGLGIQFHRFS